MEHDPYLHRFSVVVKERGQGGDVGFGATDAQYSGVGNGVLGFEV